MNHRVGALGTSPSYIEYSKMFYDGKKIKKTETLVITIFLGGEKWEKGWKLILTNIKLR